MICQEKECPDYDTSEGEPAWCNRAGCPAVVAMKKCENGPSISPKAQADIDRLMGEEQ